MCQSHNNISTLFLSLLFLQNMVGEWALPEEMVDNIPPSDNRILGHVIHRLIEHSLPPQVESTAPELPSFAIKGCLLGKTFSGKTTALKFLQKCKISFFFSFIGFYLHGLSINSYACRKHTQGSANVLGNYVIKNFIIE